MAAVEGLDVILLFWDYGLVVLLSWDCESSWSLFSWPWLTDKFTAWQPDQACMESACKHICSILQALLISPTVFISDFHALGSIWLTVSSFGVLPESKVWKFFICCSNTVISSRSTSDRPLDELPVSSSILSDVPSTWTPRQTQRRLNKRHALNTSKYSPEHLFPIFYDKPQHVIFPGV